MNKISSLVIDEIKKIRKNKELNYNECAKNMAIYLSYYLKSSYYEVILTQSLKFLNKEYKNDRKILKNVLNNKNKQLNNLNLIDKNIQSIDKDLFGINEKTYNILSSKIDNSILQKNQLQLICDNITNDYQIKIVELENEKNKINKSIKELDDQINNSTKFIEDLK